MKIEHVNGCEVDTDILPDVDAMLMEESKKLHETFAKYNRQLCLIGEMKGSNDSTKCGCVFFHIGHPKMEKEESAINYDKFMRSIHNFVFGFTNGAYILGSNPNFEPPTSSL